jgi:hypothetical protein
LFRHLLLQIGGANIENPPPSSSLAEEERSARYFSVRRRARFADARGEATSYIDLLIH